LRTKQIFYYGYRITILIVISIAFIFLAISNTGCSKYRSFTLVSAIGDCSFEYPASYNIKDAIRGEGRIFIPSFSGGWQKHEKDGFLIVFLQDTRSDLPDFVALVDLMLHNIQQQQDSDNFRIIERSPINIDNAPGEKFVYQYIINENDWSFEYIQGSAVEVGVSFERNGFLYTILVDAALDRIDKAKQDFECISRSFKFLD
jgi:hypothetical protein